MNGRAMLRSALHALSLVDDLGVWVGGSTDGDRSAPAYPRTDRALDRLAADGVAVIINLHERPHIRARLALHGLREVHVPIRDFAAPIPAQLDAALAAIDVALATAVGVAVHCGGGLGRNGTSLPVTLS